MSTQCRAETTVGGKYRTCEREAGHGGRHSTTYCGKPYLWMDTEPSPTAKAIERIYDAMEILEAAGCGGVGADGMALDEMRVVWDRGEVPGDTTGVIFREGQDTLKTIWKYRLNSDQALTEVRVPRGAEFITAQAQLDWICVWALVDPAAPEVTRRILLVGTGTSVRYAHVKYIGTVQRNGFVFHVFEVLKDNEKEQSG